ncbi:HD domain-containing protein [Candidatus Sumerlaeota bacterium]|nr:HD domain-containing protein [Candidatus Sumerlaeota bacterium]
MAQVEFSPDASQSGGDPRPVAEVIDPLCEPAEGLSEKRITYGALRNDPEIVALIDASDAYLNVIGYTDHGLSHVDRVAKRAYRILKELGAPQRECELAAVCGLMHDIGNLVNRDYHSHHGAIMCFQLLRERGMGTVELATVMGAVGNHGDERAEAISRPSAALILADKSDVLRRRVRNPSMINFDIHDRVNYAAEKSELAVDKDNGLITLNLAIDTRISQVMEYFEIFLERMRMCRASAEFLNADFHLVINEVQLL